MARQIAFSSSDTRYLCPNQEIKLNGQINRYIYNHLINEQEETFQGHHSRRFSVLNHL